MEPTTGEAEDWECCQDEPCEQKQPSYDLLGRRNHGRGQGNVKDAYRIRKERHRKTHPRNYLCPCSSGKKFKLCCREVDS